jgi:hypothetical protein
MSSVSNCTDVCHNCKQSGVEINTEKLNAAYVHVSVLECTTKSQYRDNKQMLPKLWQSYVFWEQNKKELHSRRN